MESMSEKEFYRVRLRFIDLIKSFFISEPDAEKMGRWRGIFASLASEHINPLFDGAVSSCCELLAHQNLKDLQDEFYGLFIDPFSEQLIATNASFYVDGRNHGATLAQFRGFLGEAGLVKEKNVIETEDSLVVMLDALARLIEEEDGGNLLSRELQTQLIGEFLEPLAERMYHALEADGRTKFYLSCGKFLKGYLDLERGLMMEV